MHDMYNLNMFCFEIPKFSKHFPTYNISAADDFENIKGYVWKSCFDEKLWQKKQLLSMFLMSSVAKM